MGVPQPPNVQLTTQFPVAEPTVQIAELLDMARRANPQLNALRQRERSADVNVSQARSNYLPSFSLRTGIGGFTEKTRDIESRIRGAQSDAARSRADCFTTDSIRRGAGLPGIGQQCSGIVFTPDLEAAIRADNSQFPFSMTRDPITVSASLSLPIFDGFRREEQIQQATASRRDAQYRVRDQELRLTADVTAAHLTLTTAYRTVQRSDFERAESDRINAVYEYHKAFATLEGAVGRPLR
jgi:outer membrane protein